VTKREELFRRAKDAPANWKKEDLEKLYIEYDFEIIQKKKHAFAIHQIYRQLRGTLPNHRSFLPAYVRDAVKLIEEAQKLDQEASSTSQSDTNKDEKENDATSD
jgi:dienelactone hydrolase